MQAPPLKKVAIACQGGGSHAAFAAGVLKRVLSPELRGRFELVALSGTSGGAMCAALAWSGLVAQGHDEAIARLDAFWHALKATPPFDWAGNLWGQWVAHLPITIEISPYDYPALAEDRLRELVRAHVGLAGLPRQQRETRGPKLLVGATEVLSGERVVFGGNGLIDEHLIASAAVPPLYRAVRIGARRYWDGLFTSNPPMRELTDEKMVPDKPDEIWLIQINPQKLDHEPTRISDILDRRNELAGNLSLAQERYFIEKINQLVAQHGKEPVKGAGKRLWNYRHIEVRTIEMPFADLDHASKLDRSPTFIQKLMDRGEQMGAALLDAPASALKSSIPMNNVCVS